MAIPEAQLDTWSHQGSITQSADTYNGIKMVLEAPGTPYSGRSFTVFLQGSYGNDTNIYAESDVDIVIVLDDCYYSDLEALSPAERKAYDGARRPATYNYPDFKRDVLTTLNVAYGRDVDPGDKAIAIKASGSRRKADVIVATQFRRYRSFVSPTEQVYVDGICFWNGKDEQIANFPKQHSANCTAKHQSTKKWFKPLVRVFKNLRSRMEDEGLIASGTAPSYYIEGLLYNVPDDCFGSSYEDSVVNGLNWILKADRSKFLCANELYYLLREGSLVTWRAAKCDDFVNAAVSRWKNW